MITECEHTTAHCPVNSDFLGGVSSGLLGMFIKNSFQVSFIIKCSYITVNQSLLGHLPDLRLI